MKKLFVTFVLLFSLGTIFTSCREEKSPADKIENAVDDAGDAMEDAADDIEDALD